MSMDDDTDAAHAELQAAVRAVAVAQVRVTLDATVSKAPTVGAAIDVLARTIWGEARGEGQAGMEMVASVVLNRVAHPRWWGATITGVCLDPYQFSCWLADDPNLPKMKAVTNADPDFKIALDVAYRAVMGTLVDASKGADSYYDTSIPVPSWAHGRDPVLVYRDFRFFRLEI